MKRADDVIERACRARALDRCAVSAVTWFVVVTAPIVWLAFLFAPTDSDCFAMQSEAKGHLRLIHEARRRGTLERWRPVTECTRYAYFVDDNAAYAIATDPALGPDTWRVTSTGELEHVVQGCR